MLSTASRLRAASHAHSERPISNRLALSLGYVRVISPPVGVALGCLSVEHLFFSCGFKSSVSASLGLANHLSYSYTPRPLTVCTILTERQSSQRARQSFEF